MLSSTSSCQAKEWFQPIGEGVPAPADGVFATVEDAWMAVGAMSWYRDSALLWRDYALSADREYLAENAQVNGALDRAVRTAKPGRFGWTVGVYGGIGSDGSPGVGLGVMWGLRF